MADRKPRIGILGIMQDLYDDMIPGIAHRQEGYAAEIASQLSDVGEFIPSKAIKYREDAEGRLVRVANADEICDPGTATDVHLPAPSYWPIVLAIGVMILGYGIIFQLGIERLEAFDLAQ